MAVKPPFSNFGSDHARVSVFRANEFYCCRTEYRKAIYLPIPVYTAEVALKLPFSDIGFDHARVAVF